MWTTLRSLVKTPKPRQKWPWELVAANQALRSHISEHLTVLRRTLNDILSFLSLVGSPALDKEGFRQLGELAIRDPADVQFLGCEFKVARNRELWGVYEEQMNKASTQGAIIAKEKFKVHAKTAVMVAAVISGFFIAAGLASGVAVLSVGTGGVALPIIALAACLWGAAMPVAYDRAKPRFQWLATHRKALDEKKRTCELVHENSCKQTATLAEVDISMRGVSASAKMHSETIEKMMRGSGSRTEKTKKLWRAYRSPERLGILTRFKEQLSDHIGAFEALVTDLKKDFGNS